jgi:hypothetical protein
VGWGVVGDFVYGVLWRTVVVALAMSAAQVAWNVTRSGSETRTPLTCAVAVTAWPAAAAC